MELLDEKGFVFLDKLRRPFKYAMYGDSPWLFYWHKHEKCWVTFRKVTQMEIWQFPRNLTDEEQDIYHRLQEAWERHIDGQE